MSRSIHVEWHSQGTDASEMVLAEPYDALAISSSTERPQEEVVDSGYTICRKPVPQN